MRTIIAIACLGLLLWVEPAGAQTSGTTGAGSGMSGSPSSTNPQAGSGATGAPSVEKGSGNSSLPSGGAR
jgi:hypothetical protein